MNWKVLKSQEGCNVCIALHRSEEAKRMQLVGLPESHRNWKVFKSQEGCMVCIAMHRSKEAKCVKETESIQKFQSPRNIFMFALPSTEVKKQKGLNQLS